MSGADGMEKLHMLENMVQGVDAENPSFEQQREQAKAQAEASEADAAAQQWGMLMFTLGGFAQMIAPELQPVYTEERCFAWGQQANAVAVKYGWNNPAHMPELALIASTAGFAVPTYMVIRAKLEMKQQAEEAGIVGKLRMWWQQRKARNAAPAPQPPEGGADGHQQ